MSVFNAQAFETYAGDSATVAAESVSCTLELINEYDNSSFENCWMIPYKVLTPPVAYEGKSKVLDCFFDC